MGVKVYYLAPTRHVPPDGPIALGSIITDPRRPEIAINSSTPAIQELKVHETVELNHSLGGVVPGLGMDAEAGIRAASGNRSSYAFEKIVTREIFPDLETVRSLFSGDACVQQSIKDRRWQLSVFLITGVQVAYGAEVLLTRARERGVYLQTGVDLTAVTGTPFVFAYRLRQILYRRKKVQEQRDHIKGDLLGVYDGKENMRLSSDEGGEVYEVQFAGLDKEDVDLPEIFNLNTEDMASPEGEYHRIAFPQPEDADSDDN
ncbi:hypothetical protein PG999_004300 [Apiospora kogelbergensis]|uniref:Uncharacterized protein n=1 Tax=Apiospora kogelbergensis TaxID=1337665 RepID=A0AAW0QYZ2_9PEZI